MTPFVPFPTAYELKRSVARNLGKFWLGERLAALPHAPIYVFPDQVAFDSDAVDLMSRQILTGPLQLPHSDVIFEVAAATAEYKSIAVYARMAETSVEGFLFVRDERSARWSDVPCYARFLPDGVADVEAHPTRIPDAVAPEFFPALTGTVWRALGLLHAKTPTHEGIVSHFRRSQLARRGVRGWNYRVAAIDLTAIRALVEAAVGTHAPPRWHIRRGHWRQLPNGRRVFVRECEVGDSMHGGIIKDYRVDLGSAA